MLGYYPYQAHGSLCHRYLTTELHEPYALDFILYIRHMVCRYFLPFSPRLFIFVRVSFCCGDAFLI